MCPGHPQEAGANPRSPRDTPPGSLSCRRGLVQRNAGAQSQVPGSNPDSTPTLPVAQVPARSGPEQGGQS